MSRNLALAVVSLALLLTLSAEVCAQDFEALAKDVAQELAARQYDKVEARFDARMASAMPLEKLQSFWDATLGQVGPLKAVTSTAMAELQGYHVVTLTCAFEKAPLNLRLAFDKDSKIAGFFLVPVAAPWNAPDYANPRAFHEQSVTLTTGQWQLPGTLTVPNGAGPFPAVVLVHGSAPHDEDETIGPNKPFKDLAWGLASRGIAVLRYEKRTHKYAAQLAEDSNLTVKEEVTDDARAAAALLATHPEVDRKRIYVLGHSLGGMLAPRIAECDDQIAGIIIMAGSTRQLGQIVVDQVKYLSALQSGPAGDEAKKQVEAAEKFARDYNSPTLKPGETVSMLGVPLPAAYVLDLRSYDPAATAARLKIPILVLQAESDYQVTKKDFEGWEKALAGHRNVTMKSYPGICHLFTPAGNPPSPADYDKPGHVARSMLDDIVSWVDAQHGELR